MLIEDPTFIYANERDREKINKRNNYTYHNRNDKSFIKLNHFPITSKSYMQIQNTLPMKAKKSGYDLFDEVPL